MILTSQLGVLDATCENARSRDLLDRAIFETVTFGDTAMPLVTQIVSSDPSCIMARILAAYMHLFDGTAVHLPLADSMLASCQGLLDKCVEREKLHFQAVQAVFQGRYRFAGAIWEDILLKYPQDLFALFATHMLYILFTGETVKIRDAAARVMPTWTVLAKHKYPRYFSQILAFFAFGLEENNEYGRAEQAAREALVLDNSNVWAIHTMAHVFEMQGRAREGLEFMKATKQHWQKSNSLSVHNAWHYAVFLAELGNFDEVLEIFDTVITAGKSSSMLDFADGASLLWRLEHLVPASTHLHLEDRYKKLLPFCLENRQFHLHAFVDAHMMMVLLSVPESDHLTSAFIKSMRTYANEEGTPYSGKSNMPEAGIMARNTSTEDDNRKITARIGLPVVFALKAFKEQRFADVIDTLLPVVAQLAQIAGSNAQRDVFVGTLVEAAIRAGSSENIQYLQLARAFLAERASEKCASTVVWSRLTSVLEQLGCDKEAIYARANATETEAMA